MIPNPHPDNFEPMPTPAPEKEYKDHLEKVEHSGKYEISIKRSEFEPWLHHLRTAWPKSFLNLSRFNCFICKMKTIKNCSEIMYERVNSKILQKCSFINTLLLIQHHHFIENEGRWSNSSRNVRLRFLLFIWQLKTKACSVNQMEMHVLAEDINHCRLRSVSLFCDSEVFYGKQSIRLAFIQGIILPSLPQITYLKLFSFMVPMFPF